MNRGAAIRPELMPTIQVTWTGTRCLASTAANQRGSSLSRDIENHTGHGVQERPELKMVISHGLSQKCGWHSVDVSVFTLARRQWLLDRLGLLSRAAAAKAAMDGNSMA